MHQRSSQIACWQGPLSDILKYLLKILQNESIVFDAKDCGHQFEIWRELDMMMTPRIAH